MCKISILLATYNGERFIEEQLNSLVNQTVRGINIIINDDGSTDKTMDIVRKFARTDRRIKYSEKQFGGAALNFRFLIESNRDCDYMFLCDQDDIWEPNKVELSIEAARITDNSATLVYCDRSFIDKNGQSIEIADKSKSEESLKSILSQNHIYGCSMMLNRKLIDMLEFPTNLAMHDYWIALTAGLKGSIIHLRKQLVQYRLHEGNVTGGVKQLGVANKVKTWDKVNNSIRETIRMCDCFCDKYEAKSNNTDLSHYKDMLEAKGITRVAKAILYGFRRDSIRGSLRYYYALSTI